MDLDLRDLQKSGRIGRIDVEHVSKEGNSKGIIKIPSSLTRKETALLAATVETVSRVGPCEADFILKNIKDVRETKRARIIERAAELLKEWDQKSLDASEIEEKIDTDIKLGAIISWGPDDLPAGPDVVEDPELIIVEGRADVLNLLRIGVKNTIAVQGTNVPKSIIGLIKKKKSVIAFLDGDRGGTLILKELLQVTKIDYVVRAPEGYEVEELTRKQMIKILQNKRRTEIDPLIEEEYVSKKDDEEKNFTGKEKVLYRFLKKLKVKQKDVIIDKVRSIETGQTVGFDQSLNKLFEIPVSELFDKIDHFEDSKFLIIDGILTNRLLSLLMDIDIKFIACKNKEEDIKIPERIIVFYF